MSGKTYKKLSVVKLSANFREAIKVVDTELIPPKDEEILVKNKFVGINATDILLSAGRRDDVQNQVPFDIGFDALGVIEQLGKNIKNFKKGQFVFISDWPPRAYAQYLYAKPEELILVPELSPEFVALRSGLTASIGLEQAGRIKKGDKVLITAATGGTGHICVQWAKAKGCHVIGMTSSSDKAKVIEELGCNRVINYKRENVDRVLTDEYPLGVDVIWETIGGRVCETLFKHLAIKGRFLIVGGISGYKTVGFPDISLPIAPNELLSKNQCLVGFTVEGYSQLYKQYSQQLIEAIVSKKLNIILDFGQKSENGIFEGIEAVVRGVEHLHKRKNCGKVVVKLDKS